MNTSFTSKSFELSLICSLYKLDDDFFKTFRSLAWNMEEKYAKKYLRDHIKNLTPYHEYILLKEVYYPDRNYFLQMKKMQRKQLEKSNEQFFKEFFDKQSIPTNIKKPQILTNSISNILHSH